MMKQTDIKKNLYDIESNLGDYYSNIDQLTDTCKIEAIEVLLSELESIQARTDEALEEASSSRNHIAFDVIYKKKHIIDETINSLEFLLNDESD